jgi:hypothetical protein
MSYDWYKIENLDDFNGEDLVSKEITLELEGQGVKDILITKGNGVSILIDDIFLMINLNDRNPFEQDERAVYLDANNDIWVGFEL